MMVHMNTIYIYNQYYLFLYNFEIASYMSDKCHNIAEISVISRLVTGNMVFFIYFDDRFPLFIYLLMISWVLLLERPLDYA